MFGRVEVKMRKVMNEIGELERIEAGRELEERKERLKRELAELALAQEVS